MLKREVIQTLLAKEIPERVGLNEAFWPHIIENAWGEQGIEKDTCFPEYFDLDMQCTNWFNIAAPCPDLAKVMEESDEWIVNRDGWGCISKTWKEKAGTPEHIGYSITSPEIWFKEFRDAVIAVKPEDCFKLAEGKKRYQIIMAGDQFSTMSCKFIFEWLRHVLGDVCMLESILLEKEFIHDFNSVMTDKLIEIFEYAFSEIGLPDGVHIYEDLGYTKAAFISPSCHDEMILPYHKKFFGMFKDYNLPIIMHTCGDFRPHLDSIVEAGVDCIQAMEAKTGMDVVKMAEVYKDKLCFMGNLNIMDFESGDRERIKNEVLYKLKGMKELRAPYVFMSDHSIPPSVKLDDYKYILDLYKENCFY